MTEKAAFKVAEVAVAIDCDVKTIRKGIAAGEIPSFKVGAALRVPGWWVRQQSDGPAASRQAA